MQRILLAIIVLELSLQIDICLFQQARDAEFAAVGSLNVSLTTFCLAALYVPWMFELSLRRGSSRPVRLSVPAVSYVAAVAVSAAVALDRKLAFFDFFVVLQGFLLYLYVSNRVRAREDVVFLVTMFAIGLLVQAVIMIGVWIVGHDVSLGFIHATMADSRVEGTLGHPNFAGSMLALLLVPVASIWFVPLGRWRKVLAAVAFCLGSLALVLTQSRGAWAAFGLSGLIIFIAIWRRGWMSGRMAGAVGAGAILLSLLSYPLIASRLQSDDRGAAAARVPLIQMGLRIITENPVLGVGAGNCHHAVLAEAGRVAFRSEWLSTIHNKYILVGVETGVVGLLLFLWFLGDTVRQGWIGWRCGDPLLSPVALALAAAILGQMVHMLVDIFNKHPQVESFWCCAGLIAAISCISTDGQRRGAA